MLPKDSTETIPRLDFTPFLPTFSIQESYVIWAVWIFQICLHHITGFYTFFKNAL